MLAAVPARPALADTTGPDPAKAVAYLVDPANMHQGKYYGFMPEFPDYGLTVDGIWALAATGTNDAKAREMTAFISSGGIVEGGQTTLDNWLGIGGDWPSGGSVAKTAVLAQVTGADPRDFAGHDLIDALHDLTCTGVDTSLGCAGAGNYRFAESVFSQSLGVIAQVRAGSVADAAAPVGFLRGLQHADGWYASLIPVPAEPTGDVDSTAMAAMALDLLDDTASAAAVDKAVAWVAGRQNDDGSFPGVKMPWQNGDAPKSTNSTALAVQALSLDAAAHAEQIAKAKAWLATTQNSDGGFDVTAVDEGSDVRATTQIVVALTGTSYGTLLRDLTTRPSPSATASATPSVTATPGASASVTASPSQTPGAGLPVTGVEVTTMASVAVALIGAGAVLLLVTRRRRDSATGRP
ncbi:hypothetical protein Cme02nite_00450 [Catellatospora methionotrophica]|uniref:Prenyltransferase alpha-alpha toroid domain-containing protein n=1 Tax=Catellatospora methionotrophica TaxID=121620 RepID=A0A8J3L4M9_9ACTN|nr:hypothetical protein Cme02nite_00450 [Catellatospora methionotrophica]